MSDPDATPRLRPATAADVPRLAELATELGYTLAAAELRPRVERTLTRPDAVLYVADSPSAGVVGWILAAEQETLETGPRCEILGLVVAVAGRRQGVGRRLVAAVEEWGRGRGLARVIVRSNVRRPESHPFYERLGYGRVKTQHVYAKAL